MSEEPRDPVLSALGELPPRDVDPFRREAMRRKALLELDRQAALARHPWLAALVRSYDRVLEPALVSAFAAGYLAWAFDVSAAILLK